MASAAAGRRGRFLPGDPRVAEPYRLTPQLALRVAILAFLALAVFAVLFLRLWALQVLAGDRYLAQANDNRVRTLRIEAPRGPILDRNGQHRSSRTCPARASSSGRPTCRRRGRAQRKELRALSDGHGHAGQARCSRS